MASGDAIQTTARPPETLDDAWRAALQYDDRIKSGRLERFRRRSGPRRRLCGRLPSVSVGANALAVSEQLSVTTRRWATCLCSVQGSLGFHAVVTQPIYTAGKIDSQVAAAGAGGLRQPG